MSSYPDHFPGSNVTPSTLVDLLRWRARHQFERRAYTFLLDGEKEEVHLTYGELDQRARHISSMLRKQEVTGERALLLYPPGLEYIAAFFGCLYAGVIAVPAYPPQPHRPTLRLQSIVADAQATIGLTTSSILSPSDERSLFAHTPNLEALHWLITDTIANESANAWQEPDINSKSLAFLQYTSGSTSLPKGVMLSHGNLLHNLAQIQRCFGHTSNSRGVFWLPPYHDMGLIGGILQPLYVGFPITLMSPVAFLQRPIRWLQAISRTKATTSGGPNFAYDLCVRKIMPKERETLDLSSWELACNGAEPIRPQTLEDFTEAFAPAGFRRSVFYPCYGLAEATLIVSGGKKTALPITLHVQRDALEQNCVLEATSEKRDVQVLVGCGQTVEGQQIVIVHPETLRRCAPDEVGEIWVSGPSVAQGYWGRAEETEYSFCAQLTDVGQELFLRTGDLGFMHDGELFITGRLKDLLVIWGRNHYPQDIELTVEQSHPSLRSGCGAVFSVEIDGVERVVIVHEVERHYRNVDKEEVIAAIRRAVAKHHDLQVYSVLLLKPGGIPKTSSGKLQRYTCRNAFLNGSLKVW